jgi:hypothetical protein
MHTEFRMVLSAFIRYYNIIKYFDAKNLLASKHYPEQVEKAIQYASEVEDVTLIIDSGAFSVWNAGGKVDVMEYLQFLKEFDKNHRSKFKEVFYVSLDVIPGTVSSSHITDVEIMSAVEEGFANYLIFRDAGLDNVIHVLHQGDDDIVPDIVPRLINTAPSYIGISPSNAVMTTPRMKWLDSIFNKIPEDIRKVFVVASDLSPMEHLKSLGIVARSTSLSVAKTVNLPSNATKEEISELYIKAYKEGVIGVTVYRDGCREGVLVHQTDNEDKETIVKNNAPKRPKSLPAHVYRVNILNKINNLPEKWIIFVGLLNDEPYEIIAGKINGHDFDPSVTEGEIIKTKLQGKKVYQFAKDGEILCEDICSQYLNELREYSTRLMSLALRHGAGIEHLQSVLKKSGTIVDFNQAIVRAISKYVKETKTKERCPRCNEELIYLDGCVKCKNPECGFSKCG